MADDFDEVVLDESGDEGEVFESDDFESFDPNADEVEETTETETVEADQPETAEVEETSTETPADDLPSEEENVKALEEAKAADQRITLKHLDDTKDFNLADDKDKSEIIILAQKGMDYDRIREERDSLKSERETVNDHEAFLKDLAELSGMSIEDLIIDTKARLVLDDQTKQGYNITLEQAKYRVQSEMKQLAREKANAVKETPVPEVTESPKPTPEKTAAELRQASFARFNQRYPNVNAKDIPKAVWDEFGDGTKKDLSDIYAAHREKELMAEIETLKTQATKPKSTGSRKSMGTPEIDHDFDGWEDL